MFEILFYCHQSTTRPEVTPKLTVSAAPDQVNSNPGSYNVTLHSVHQTVSKSQT